MKTKAQIEEKLKRLEEELDKLNQEDYPNYTRVHIVQGNIAALSWVLSA